MYNKLLVKNAAKVILNPRPSLAVLGIRSNWGKCLDFRTYSKNTYSTEASSGIHPDNNQGHVTQKPRRQLPDFQDLEQAFRGRSTLDLMRTYALLRCCTIPWLIEHQIKMLQVTRRILGKGLFERLMRSSFYGQFLAGDTDKRVLENVNRFNSQGISAMFAFTANEGFDLLGVDRQSLTEKEIQKNNYEALLQQIELARKASGLDEERCKWTTKITFLASIKMLKWATTVINHNALVMDDLQSGRLNSGKTEGLVRAISQAIAVDATKLSEKHGLPPPFGDYARDKHIGLYKYNMATNLALINNQNVQQKMKDAGYEPPLPDMTLQNDLVDTWRMVKNLCKKTEEYGLCMNIDAEQSYVQSALDLLTVDAMRFVNKNYAVTYCTVQNYLRDATDKLSTFLHLSETGKFHFGVKMVRGGYVEEERRLAEELSYDDPVNPSYEATTDMYMKNARYMLQEFEKTPDRIQILFATHNVNTVNNVLKIIHDMGLNYNVNQIAFAQLFGMRDFIATPLAIAGQPVRKLLHYGPVEQAMVYMSRRLNENKSGMATADLDRTKLGEEIKRRLLRRKSRAG